MGYFLYRFRFREAESWGEVEKREFAGYGKEWLIKCIYISSI